MSLKDFLDPHKTSWFVKNRLIKLTEQTIVKGNPYIKKLELIYEELQNVGIDDKTFNELYEKTVLKKTDLKSKIEIEIFKNEIREAITIPETDLERKLRQEAKGKSESRVGSVPEKDSRDVKRKKRRKERVSGGTED